MMQACQHKKGDTMTLDELKQTIEQRAGVPASLLTGETAEENIAQAKAMLAYKREYEQQRPKTTAERFSDWLGAQLEDNDRRTAELLGRHYEAPPADPAESALAEVAEAYRVEAGGYPMTKDSGEVTNISDPRPAREQFTDWLRRETAFDPFKDADGWKK